jgi:hypothetical protein
MAGGVGVSGRRDGTRGEMCRSMMPVAVSPNFALGTW